MPLLLDLKIGSFKYDLSSNAARNSNRVGNYEMHFMLSLQFDPFICTYTSFLFRITFQYPANFNVFFHNVSCHFVHIGYISKT